MSDRQDTVSGIGTLIAVDNTKRRAIYWRDRRVCFLDGEYCTCGLKQAEGGGASVHRIFFNHVDRIASRTGRGNST